MKSPVQKLSKNLLFAIIIALMVIASACNRPAPLAGEATSTSELSESILTEAASTIDAGVQETQTRQAMLYPTVETSEPEKPEATPTPKKAKSTAMEKAPNKKTQAANQTATKAAKSSIKRTPIPTATEKMEYFTPNPTIPSSPKKEGGFIIKSFYIPSCNGITWAFIGIQNIGNQPLESGSLYIQDLTKKKGLFGPSASNAPFKPIDESCSSGGKDKLNSNKMANIGAPLGNNNLKGKTIQATIILCTGQDLTGACYQQKHKIDIP